MQRQRGQSSKTKQTTNFFTTVRSISVFFYKEKHRKNIKRPNVLPLFLYMHICIHTYIFCFSYVMCAATLFILMILMMLCCGNLTGNPPNTPVPAWMARQSAWQSQLGGAFGFTYGGQGIWWACWNTTYTNSNCGTVGTPQYKTWDQALEFVR